MSKIMAFFYDRPMQGTEAACLIGWRKELLKGVRGKVLEIGAGTGASLALYPQTENLEITLSEPNSSMRKKLLEKIQSLGKSNLKVLESTAEDIDSPDAQYDAVFLSLVCCSVKNVEQALKEIKRVLKPSGQFIFIEHVAAEQGSHRRKWQNRLNGIWGVIAGNCHLNRETEQSILDVGFIIKEIKRESLRKAPSIVRPTIRGIAILPLLS